jgi:hypothetical protein
MVSRKIIDLKHIKSVESPDCPHKSQYIQGIENAIAGKDPGLRH